MVYLDYSATTPIDKRVLESFERTSLEYIGNPNSLHSEGVKAKKLMDAAVSQVASILKVKDEEIIFTSGASESNNLAIFGVINKYKDRGKTIITTKFEHSSILESVNYLENNGYHIKYVKLDNNGQVDLNDLEKLIDDDTIIVSICEVNSETGIQEDVCKIGEILKKYPRVIYHVDGTQAVGKKNINLENIDLYSFSAHKIYGPKGIGVLVKKENIELMPIIHGGKSQTIYRAGTPPLSLMVACAKALRLITDDLEYNIKYVADLNKKIINNLKDIDGISLNSNSYSIPHIINISVKDVKPETILHALEENEIYISTKTACSVDDISIPVYTLTGDLEKAKTSIRISLSHLTKENEIDFFIEKLKEKIKKLQSIRN